MKGRVIPQQCAWEEVFHLTWDRPSKSMLNGPRLGVAHGAELWKYKLRISLASFWTRAHTIFKGVVVRVEEEPDL